MFRGCKQEDMPPHIFAAAQSAYRNMLATRMDQSVVLMGHSGSGKTINSRHIMHYLAAAASSQHSALTGGLFYTLNPIKTLTSITRKRLENSCVLQTTTSKYIGLFPVFPVRDLYCNSNLKFAFFDGTEMYKSRYSGNQNALCMFFKNNSRLFVETVITSRFALIVNSAAMTKNEVTKRNSDYKLFCSFRYHSACN